MWFVSNVVWRINPNFIFLRKMSCHHKQFISILVLKTNAFVKIKSVPSSSSSCGGVSINKMSGLTSWVIISLRKWIRSWRSVKLYLKVWRVVFTTKTVFQIHPILPVFINSRKKVLFKLFRILALVIERRIKASFMKFQFLAIFILLIALVTKNILNRFHFK